MITLMFGAWMPVPLDPQPALCGLFSAVAAGSIKLTGGTGGTGAEQNGSPPAYLKEYPMLARYKIVEHDGGWAYKLGDVFSETFPDHDAAMRAAEQAADRQQVAGESTDIAYQDAKGQWKTEFASGGERPETEVVDSPDAPGTKLP